MRLALDAMGGDYAPAEVVRGAVEATGSGEFAVVLVGRPEELEGALRAAGAPAWHQWPAGQAGEALPDTGLWVLPASEVITNHEPPAQAVRHKKDASMNVAMRLVKDGTCDAFVSAGSTGAVMTAGLLTLGRLPGVDRAGIGTVLPTAKGGGVLVLDSGANMDARPEHLAQYAVLGSVYAELALGVANPRVGLLNVGTEEAKGNELTRQAYGLLQSLPINFAGNVEGNQIHSGDFDVVVCDGFAGNVVLKHTEGLALTLMSMIKTELTAGFVSTLGALMARGAFRRLQKTLDPQEYGGAPMLGIDGVVIKCHGNSRARGIYNGLRLAARAVARGAVAEMRRRLAMFSTGPNRSQEE